MLSEPVEQKRRPATAIDAKFSLPFTISTALVHGDVRLEHYFPNALADTDVLELARKVSVEIDPALNSEWGMMVISTRSGAILSARLEHALGHPGNPIGKDALVRKFMDCASHARNKPCSAALQGVVDAIERLEEIRDAGRDLIDAFLN